MRCTNKKRKKKKKKIIIYYWVYEAAMNFLPSTFSLKWKPQSEQKRRSRVKILMANCSKVLLPIFLNFLLARQRCTRRMAVNIHILTKLIPNKLIAMAEYTKVMAKTPNLSRYPRTSNRAEVSASATVMRSEKAPIAMLSGTARDIQASNSSRVKAAK